MACKIDGCERRAQARGWCDKHYRRWRAHGDPLALKRRPNNQTLPDLAAWILQRVDRRPDGCWDSTGTQDDRGYGRIRGGGRRSLLVHRVICEHFHGPAPAGKPMAIHSCDRPICCNPAHLRWGSHADNTRDAVERARFLRGQRIPWSKLSPAAVRWIRKLAAQGCPKTKLAKCYGVERGTIRGVINRKTWRHVT